MKNWGEFAVARAFSPGCFMVIALFLSLGQAGAQSLRDPTVPPAEAGLGSVPQGPKPAAVTAGSMSVIVRGGRPYLVVGTRLYAQGEKLGQARIERITETEVWLREDGTLRKVPQFPGVLRRTAMQDCAAVGHSGAKAAKVENKPSSSKTSSLVAPCAGVQQ